MPVVTKPGKRATDEERAAWRDAKKKHNLSVERHPAFQVAIYSLIHLAGLLEYGPGRTNDYVPLPKWRRKARRPSLLDLLSLLRKEIVETTRDTAKIETVTPANETRGAPNETHDGGTHDPILAENLIVSAYT